MWDRFQRDRLVFEEQLLKQNHPNCEFTWGENDAFVKIWHNVCGAYYLLRIYVPGTYPDQKPKVFVEYPFPLMTYAGMKKISDYAPSHNYHILSSSTKGEVQICHFAEDAWDATKTIHLVVLKAKLWLQAYGEHHLKTGQPICDFFNDCRY